MSPFVAPPPPPARPAPALMVRLLRGRLSDRLARLTRFIDFRLRLIDLDFGLADRLAEFDPRQRRPAALDAMIGRDQAVIAR
jgi:hypothetical protein